MGGHSIPQSMGDCAGGSSYLFGGGVWGDGGLGAVINAYKLTIVSLTIVSTNNRKH